MILQQTPRVIRSHRVEKPPWNKNRTVEESYREREITGERNLTVIGSHGVQGNRRVEKFLTVIGISRRIYGTALRRPPPNQVKPQDLADVCGCAVWQVDLNWRFRFP